MKYLFSSIILLSALTLGSCSGTRNLSPAKVDMPADYYTGSGTDSLSIADLNWWEFYTDTTLTGIMRVVLDNNKDLLKAAARIDQMREQYGINKANMLPQIGMNVEYSHETNDYHGSGTTKDPEYDLKFPVTWEMNLWGSLNHAKNAGKARYLASEEGYRAMRMELIAETATVYFRLMFLENELSIVRQTLQTRLESLEQARIRFEGGLTSETVYQQAKVEYSTAASLVPNLELQIATARNALTMLMGEYPHDVLKGHTIAFNAKMSERLPVGVPSDLLKRRPDLRAAEFRLKAAMADVGMNYADRFPSLRIGFTPGWENDELSSFFKSPFTYVIGSVTGPIFDFGRRKRRYKASIAAYEQARLDYEKAVISAFTEVNTTVTAYNHYRENRELMVDLCDAAEKYVQLARLQYRGGTLNYIDVLDAQRRYFNAQTGVNNAVHSEYQALINLYKVLGGGWKSE